MFFFFTKNCMYFCYQGFQCHLKYEITFPLFHIVLWSVKTITLISISLKTIKLIFLHDKNYQLQDVTFARFHFCSCLSLIHHPVLCYPKPVFLLYPPRAFFYIISYQLLVAFEVHSSIAVTVPKIIFLYFTMVYLMA